MREQTGSVLHDMGDQASYTTRPENEPRKSGRGKVIYGNRDLRETDLRAGI